MLNISSNLMNMDLHRESWIDISVRSRSSLSLAATQMMSAIESSAFQLSQTLQSGSQIQITDNIGEWWWVIYFNLNECWYNTIISFNFIVQMFHYFGKYYFEQFKKSIHWVRRGLRIWYFLINHASEELSWIKHRTPFDSPQSLWKFYRKVRHEFTKFI